MSSTKHKWNKCLKVIDKKIVVTGATGFIGNAVCTILAKQPNTLVVPVSRKNVKGYVFSDNYLDIPQGDVCIHLGEDSDRSRVNVKNNNYRVDAERVIESVINNKFDHILYASSAVVYGDVGKLPYTEQSAVVSSDEYSLAKLNNEAKILSVGGTVVRLSNVIGPGMAKNNVLSDIIRQLPHNSPLTIRNSQPIRDFIWLYDVVEVIVQLINQQIPGLFNVGTGDKTAIHDLAKICLKIDGQENREIVGLVASLAYSFNVVNINKIKETLVWSPSLNLAGCVQRILCDNRS